MTVLRFLVQISELFLRIGFFTVLCFPEVSCLYDYLILISNVKHWTIFSVAGTIRSIALIISTEATMSYTERNFISENEEDV